MTGDYIIALTIEYMKLTRQTRKREQLDTRNRRDGQELSDSESDGEPTWKDDWRCGSPRVRGCPISALAPSLPLPISHAAASWVYMFPRILSVLPPMPISKAAASARARLDWLG